MQSVKKSNAVFRIAQSMLPTGMHLFLSDRITPGLGQSTLEQEDTGVMILVSLADYFGYVSINTKPDRNAFTTIHSGVFIASDLMLQGRTVICQSYVKVYQET